MKFVQKTTPEGKVELDVKDKKILYLLSKDSRTPLTKISKQVGLSRDSVAYRIKNMTKNGVIQGYITLVDVKKFGYTSYHVFLNLNHPTQEIENKLIGALKDHWFVRAILKFSGKYDFELAVIAKSVEEFDSVLTNIIGLCSNYLQNYEILAISKNFVSKVFPGNFIQVENGKIARKIKDEKIDKKDIEILQSLSNKADRPLYEIGDEVGLSSDAVNYRIKKMKDAGVILNFLPVINYSALNYSIYAILLSLNNLSEEKEKILKDLLEKDENVLWAVKTVGRYNLLFYLCVPRAEDLHNTIIKLRTYFKEDIKEYETLVAYEQFKYVYFPEGIKVEKV